MVLRRLRGGAPTEVERLYGVGLISETNSGTGVTSYPLTDGLGSTSQLANSAGAVTDTYSYDVFGALRTNTGTTANEFRFAGEQTDTNVNRGLQYLRARSYDPALGRFISRDPLPLLQRYAYAGNNPANFVDPSGGCRVDVVLSNGDSPTNKVLSLLHARQWYHIYLVTADPITGEKTMHAAGPADDGSGLLEGKFPSLLEGDALAKYKSDRKLPVHDDGDSCQSINQSFDITGGAINNARISYHFWNTNSNAFARALLEGASIQPRKPDGWAPGWHTHLSYWSDDGDGSSW